MKALSIRQPWAWLICHAGKDIENRTWWTGFRGPIWIHAGKTMTLAEYEAAMDFQNSFTPTPIILPAYDILRKECGGIVGQARIVDCKTGHPSPWFCGPYGLILTDAKPLDFIPCNGKLGFFDVLVGSDGRVEPA